MKLQLADSFDGWKWLMMIVFAADDGGRMELELAAPPNK
jgi:hypothetical protein